MVNKIKIHESYGKKKKKKNNNNEILALHISFRREELNLHASILMSILLGN
jgi:hypothetical protein